MLPNVLAHGIDLPRHVRDVAHHRLVPTLHDDQTDGRVVDLLCGGGGPRRLPPDVAEVAVAARAPLRGAGVADVEAAAERVAGRDVGGAVGGRLAGLAHGRGVRLAGEDEGVHVGLGGEEERGEDDSEDGDHEDRGEHVPPREQLLELVVEGLDEWRSHRGGCNRQVEFRQVAVASWTTMDAK